MAVMTSVKISKETLSVLKNFSQLNSNLLVKQGNMINTITGAKNVMAEATIEENFEVEFGIWDLNKFLGTVSLFDSPSFEFGEKSVRISGNNGSAVTYYYSEPSLLSTVNKKVQMPESVISFDFTESMFSDLQRAASVLALPDFKIENLKMLAGDYQVDICESVVSSFTNKNVDVKYWIALETDSTYTA